MKNIFWKLTLESHPLLSFSELLVSFPYKKELYVVRNELQVQSQNLLKNELLM